MVWVRSSAVAGVVAGRGARAVAAAAWLAAMLASPLADAADYSAPLPDFNLRGSQEPVLHERAYPRWDGIYFGGQGGYSTGNADFGNSSSSQIGYILAESELQSIVSSWTTLPQSGSNTKSYGGFLGYNFQWGEIVTGVELNYNHMSFATSAADSIGPLIVSGATQTDGSAVSYAVSVASSASVAIHDIATVRATAGWAVDRMLPYAFLGLAVGRADITHYASVTGTKTVTPINVITGLLDPAAATTGPIDLPRNPQYESKTQIAYGLAAGLGINVALTPNVFARAEWEYIGFENISDIRVAINSARLGLGVRF